MKKELPLNSFGLGYHDRPTELPIFKKVGPHLLPGAPIIIFSLAFLSMTLFILIQQLNAEWSIERKNLSVVILGLIIAALYFLYFGIRKLSIFTLRIDKNNVFIEQRIPFLRSNYWVIPLSQFDCLCFAHEYHEEGTNGHAKDQFKLVLHHKFDKMKNIEILRTVDERLQLRSGRPLANLLNKRLCYFDEHGKLNYELPSTEALGSEDIDLLPELEQPDKETPIPSHRHIKQDFVDGVHSLNLLFLPNRRFYVVGAIIGLTPLLMEMHILIALSAISVAVVSLLAITASLAVKEVIQIDDQAIRQRYSLFGKTIGLKEYPLNRLDLNDVRLINDQLAGTCRLKVFGDGQPIQLATKLDTSAKIIVYNWIIDTIKSIR